MTHKSVRLNRKVGITGSPDPMGPILDSAVEMRSYSGRVYCSSCGVSQPRTYSPPVNKPPMVVRTRLSPRNIAFRGVVCSWIPRIPINIRPFEESTARNNRSEVIDGIDLGIRRESQAELGLEGKNSWPGS